MAKQTPPKKPSYLVTINTTQRPAMGLELSYKAALSVTVQSYRFGEYVDAVQALSDAEAHAQASRDVPGLTIDVGFEVLP